MHLETTRYCNLKLLVLSNPTLRVGLFHLAVVFNFSFESHPRHFCSSGEISWGSRKHSEVMDEFMLCSGSLTQDLMSGKHYCKQILKQCMNPDEPTEVQTQNVYYKKLTQGLIGRKV